MKGKYNFLLEMTIGVFIILLINAMWFPNNMGYVGVTPNPYWIVVIFIAARYGSFQGLISGALCAVVLLASISYSTALKQPFDFSQIPYNQVLQAGLFVVFGFLVGEERRRVNSLLQKQKDQHDKLRNEFANLAMEDMARKNINVELAGRILGQADTVNTLYDVARSLVTLRVNDLYRSVLNLVKRFVGPDKCSLYIWEDEKYVLKGHKGWGDEIENRKVLDTKSDIIKMALDEKKLVTVKDVFKSEDSNWQEKKDPLMVAPLFFGEERDTVTGFILIDDISFTKLNPDSMRFLSIMSDWVSKSLDNAFSATTIRMKDVYDKELEIFNYDYGIRRLREEFFNTKITGRSAGLMLVKVLDYDTIDKAVQKDVLKTVGSVLTNTFRATDTVARYAVEDTFIVVLPGTNAEGAKIVTQRVKEEIKKTQIKPLVDMKKKLDIDISMRIFEEKYENENQLLKDVEKGLAKK